jgi:hypothetical protein
LIKSQRQTGLREEKIEIYSKNDGILIVHNMFVVGFSYGITETVFFYERILDASLRVRGDAADDAGEFDFVVDFVQANRGFKSAEGN